MMSVMKQLLAALATFAITAGSQGATFDVTNANDSGAGSLRWAIEQANSTPGADIIHSSLGFPIPTIVLLSPLPAITDTADIEYFFIDGSHAGPADGMVLAADGVILQAVRVTNFQGDGFVVRGNNAELLNIEATGNRDGIRIEGSHTSVLGATILSNTANGIWITSTGSSNQIGLPDFICAGFPSLCGQPQPTSDEIAGNGGAGVRIDGDQNTVDFVWIGLRRGGEALANGGDGIVVAGKHNSVINATISNNGGRGAVLLAPAHFANNSGSCNTGGFLGGSLIDHPRINFAHADPTAITVGGAFQGEPNASYTIEIDAETPSCSGPATTPIGTITVTTSPNGDAQWTGAVSLYSPATLAYRSVTNVAAIATRGDAEVSSLSDVVPALVTGETRADLRVVQTVAPSGAVANQVIDFVTIVTNAGPAAVENFKLSIPRTPGTIFVSATNTAGTCYLGGAEYCYVGALAIGEIATIHELVRVSATSGTLHHIATVSHFVRATDPNPANNTAVADVQVSDSTRRRSAGH
jgi:uncharacterized repeat protein (TIGR01451 family)